MDSTDPLMCGLTANEARAATDAARKADKQFCHIMQMLSGEIRSATNRKMNHTMAAIAWESYLTDAVRGELTSRGFEVICRSDDRGRPCILISW